MIKISEDGFTGESGDSTIAATSKCGSLFIGITYYTLEEKQIIGVLDPRIQDKLELNDEDIVVFTYVKNGKENYPKEYWVRAEDILIPLGEPVIVAILEDDETEYFQIRLTNRNRLLVPEHIFSFGIEGFKDAKKFMAELDFADKKGDVKASKDVEVCDIGKKSMDEDCPKVLKDC